MKSDKLLSRKINKIVSRKQDEMERQPAAFAQNVTVPNQINYNYVVIGDKTVPVYNERVPARAGVKIWVGYDAMDQSVRGRKRYQVLGTRSEDPTSGIASSFGYAPASRYEWHAKGGGQDMLHVHLRAISFLRIGVSTLNGHINLYSGKVWSGTEFISVARQDVDISTHVPSTEGKAALVMISIDTSGAVVQTKGAEVDINSLAESDRPAVPADTAFISGCVRVYHGQVIPQEGRVNTDFDDLRFSGYGTGAAGGSGDFTFRVDGAIAVYANVWTILVTKDTTIDYWYIHCDDSGSSGSTIFDVNLNGSTIFSTSGNRPTLAHDNADSWAKSGVPDTVDFVEGDIITIDIDQVASGAKGLGGAGYVAGGSGGGGTATPQSYESVAMAADQSVSSVADLTDLSITKELLLGVKYRWSFRFGGVKTSTGTLAVLITDESNSQKEKASWSIASGYGIHGYLDFVETGSGSSVTRKIRALCDTGSFNFDIATNQNIVFSVERCG